MVDAVTVEDVEAWDTDLSALTSGLGWLFARPEPKQTFGLLLRAMLADVGKKNCWGMSEHAGLATPKRFQHLLNAADNRAGKEQFGLGDYQVRKWTPWYRHVTISMLAHAFLAVTRANLGKDHHGEQTRTGHPCPPA